MDLSNLKLNTIITYQNEPYLIISSQHQKQGRGGAVVKTKLRQIITGATLEKTFSGGDKFSEADVTKSKATFLYVEKNNCYFMDTASYEQFSLGADFLSDKIPYLKEGMEVTVLNYNDQPVAIELPIKTEYKIISTPPGIKGDTAGSATKVATLETGKEIRVPLFVKEGDLVRINTETGEYVERA
jgi:elongation factor P